MRTLGVWFGYWALLAGFAAAGAINLFLAGLVGLTVIVWTAVLVLDIQQRPIIREWERQARSKGLLR